jgi:carbamate kinase
MGVMKCSMEKRIVIVLGGNAIKKQANEGGTAQE